MADGSLTLPTRHKLDVDDFDRMAEAGIFNEDDRVADTSLRYDRTVKLESYVRAGIAEYWIVDLKRRVVIVHRQPAGNAFDDARTLSAGTSLALAADPAIVIDRARILG